MRPTPPRIRALAFGPPPSRARGVAILLVLVILMLVFGMAAALLQQNVSQSRSILDDEYYQKAFYYAQAGASRSFTELSQKPFTELAAGDYLGTQDAPIAFGDGSYYVRLVKYDEDTFGIISTGYQARADSTVSTRTVELVMANQAVPRFTFGLFGLDFVHMDSNSLSDSYSSSKGTWESQAVNKASGQKYANTEGDVGSNGNISLDSNVKLLGDAQPGKDKSVTLASNTTLTGSTTPAKDNYTPDPVELPVGYKSFGVPSGASTNYVLDKGKVSFPAGNYYFKTLKTDGKGVITIAGPSIIVVEDEFSTNSNSSIVFDTAGGKTVQLYVKGDFFTSSNSAVTSTSNTPSDLDINLTSTSTNKVEWSSNSNVSATIYAPYADITFKSNSDFFGAILGKSIDVNSNGRFHFDEDLLKDGKSKAVVIPAWFEISDDQSKTTVRP